MFWKFKIIIFVSTRYASIVAIKFDYRPPALAALGVGSAGVGEEPKTP